MSAEEDVAALRVALVRSELARWEQERLIDESGCVEHAMPRATIRRKWWQFWRRL